MKVPIALGDPRSTEHRFLGYASGSGNYKVQDVASQRVFISRDVVFEEGQPHRTTVSVGEQHHQIPLFDANPGIASTPLASAEHVPAINVPDQTPDLVVNPIVNQIDRQANTPEPRRSAQVPQPSQARLQSTEYQRHEITERDEGQD